jgi:peptide-methionine (S)-S-oxide reductase
MAPFEALYPDREAFADSPAAALVNGYVAGHRDPARLADDRERLGLPASVLDQLRTVAEQRYD